MSEFNSRDPENQEEFVFVIVMVGAVAFLAYISRNSTHVQRMRSLIRSLANLKQDYKSKMHIIRTKVDVDATMAADQALIQEASIEELH